MKILVNGQMTEVTADGLDAILTELDYGQQTVATAVNETFIAMTARANTRLTSGDRLEIMAPRQGG